MNVNREGRLGFTVGAEVGKGSSVSKEIRRDLVVITGVEVESGVMVG